MNRARRPATSLQRDAAAHPFVVAVLILAAVYAALQFTPSSYAIALRMLGVADDGLVLGSARTGRSDEWVIWTPYIQLAVNNGFARINTLSLYGEDLRNFNAVPLWDWALIFKPQFWAFFVLPPAAAFSLMYAILLAACLIGWYLVALELRFARLPAAVFSIAIFTLPNLQLWWTTYGPPAAVLPWLLLVHLRPMPLHLRALLSAWVSATFLLSEFYVPFVATLVFAGGLLVLAFRPDTLRPARLAATATGAAIGAGLVVLYLWEPIQVMAATVYPGQRTHVPGGLAPKSFVIAHLFPHFAFDEWKVPYWNELEISTGGSYVFLLSLLFLDYRRLREVIFATTAEDRATRLALALLGAGALLILAWWRLPIPPSLATPLLWNAIPPQRLTIAAGLLGHAIAFVLLLRVGAVAALPRLVAAIGLIVAVALYSKLVFLAARPTHAARDLVIVPLLLIAWFWSAVRGFGMRLLICGALSNALVFGQYNPIQRAGPIFARHDTPLMRELAARQAADRRHWLVVQGLPGALQPALGFRSVAHVLIAPQLAFFRARFPDLPPDQFNQVFNRFAHIQLDPGITQPFVPQGDVIRVPPGPFE